MMHLGWFVGRGFSVHGWKQDWWGDDFRDWISPDIYLDLARALDRACFDYVMIEDGSLIPNAYGGSMDAYLRHAVNAPKADPMPLVPLMAQVDKRAWGDRYDDDGLLSALSRGAARGDQRPSEPRPLGH